MTLKEIIDKVNAQCPSSDQGIFFEPSGIPLHLDYVI
jgi:hypothetical protein